jgi:inosine-uridine nucleoside N-ribohydrolase
MRFGFALLLTACLAFAQAPVNIIFDTDMGNDCDDALALAMLHAFEKRGEAKLLAVTHTKGHPLAAALSESINAYYGRPAIPIGFNPKAPTPKIENPMLKLPGLQAKASYPDAVSVIENALRAVPDQSVVIVQVGFSTNLGALLDRPGAVELIRKKVKFLSTMAGAFPTGKKEYNVYNDVPAARRVFSDWPTPVVFSGFEIGLALEYPAESIVKDFRHSPANPVVDAYKIYLKFPHNRPTWDLTSVLYAVRPERRYFDLSATGRVGVLDDGRTTWTLDPAADRRYLILKPEQKARALEALVMLASDPR